MFSVSEQKRLKDLMVQLRLLLSNCNDEELPREDKIKNCQFVASKCHIAHNLLKGKNK